MTDKNIESSDGILVSSKDFAKSSSGDEKIPLSGSRKLIRNSIFSSSSDRTNIRKKSNHDDKSCCFKFRK